MLLRRSILCTAILAACADRSLGGVDGGAASYESTLPDESTSAADPEPSPPTKPIEGENPAGGSTLALWTEVGLELVFGSTLAENRCDDPEAWDYGRCEDELVWLVTTEIPRQDSYLRQWGPEELEWWHWALGPNEGYDDWWNGCGGLVDLPTLTIDEVTEHEVRGTIDGLVPDIFAATYSGSFVAVICN